MRTQRLSRPGLTGAVLCVLALCTFFGHIAVAQGTPNARYYQWVSPARSAPRVQYRTFQSAAVGSAVSYHIYIPEIYDSAATKRLPVVYWLHGTGGGGPGLPLLSARLDSAIRAGKVPPMLVVFPNGLVMGMWVNWKSGRVPMETVVINELIPHIDATFRTIPSREGRLIEGMSMGGYGAARLAFKYPDLFGAASLLAGGPLQQELTAATTDGATPQQAQMVLDTIYGGDQEYFKAQSPWQLAERNVDAVRRLRVRQVVGDSDNTLENNRKFHEQLVRLNIPHDFIVLPGVSHNVRDIFDGRQREKFQREVRGGRVERIRGAGHYLHLTHQREVIAMVRAFLSEKRPAPPGQATDPKFVSAQCPFDADEKALAQVRCGYVTVLENRSTPEGRRLKLAVAILKTFSQTPRPDPVVYIGGGPGLRIIGGVPRYLKERTFDALRADRDVVLYDQRGTGFADPDFCPEVAAEWRRQGADSPAARKDSREQLLARCGEIMRPAGVDLSQYNSAVSARDLDDLRRALGYDQWNLYAVSYGARVALAAMRDAAPGIRSVVLDAPLAPSRAKWFNMPSFFVDVLQRLSAECAAQPSCNAAFPNVEQTFWQTVEELDRNPRGLQLTRSHGTQATVTRSGASFVAGVSDQMRSRTGLSTVPMRIHAMRARDEATLAAVRAQRVPTAVAEGRLSPGLGFAVDCFEEAPLNTPELRERARKAHPAILIDARIFSDPTLCDGFHSFRAGPEHSRPVESDIPTLIFNGEFDLPVHRSSGPFIGRSLKNGQSVEIPGAGHLEAFQHDCTRAMTRRFLDEPRPPLDMSCVSSIPPLRFLTDVKSIRR